MIRRWRAVSWVFGLLIAMLMGCAGPDAPITENRATAPAPQPAEASTPAAATATPLFPGFSTEDLVRMTLETGDDRIDLRRVGTQWTLPEWGGYPAEQVFAKALAEGPARTFGSVPVGRYPADAAFFGFGARNAKVSYFKASGELLAEVQVGGKGEDYREAFVRLDDSPDIWRVEVDWIPLTSRPAWASRTLWRMKPSLITRLRWEGTGQPFHAEKSADGSWQLRNPENGTLSEAFFEKVLPSLAFFRSGDVIYDPDHRHMDWDGKLTMWAAGAEFVLLLASTEEGVWGKRPGEPVLFKFNPVILEMPRVSVNPNP